MWNTILHYAAEFGTAAAPIIASVIMALVGAVFYQLTGLLPGFVRAYVEQAYRNKEAEMSRNIAQALINGINAAVSRGWTGDEALSQAIDHAMRTTPESVSHFMRTSGMTRDTLKTTAEGLAASHGIPLKPVELPWGVTVGPQGGQPPAGA